ncbi:MAG: pyruvate ferredoxin oxidoreductase, partial [Parcubacteria group bacterium]
DNTIIGTKLAERSELPIMVIMDGFTTSHSVENLEMLPDGTVRKFVGRYKNKEALLNVKKPHTFGPVSLPDSYFELKIDQDEAMKEVLKNYEETAGEFKEVSGRDYELIEEYRAKDADHILVLIGSTAGTAKDVVDNIREKGEKVGLVKIKLFRPFPYKEVAVAVSKAKSIAVMDRSISFGSVPPLYSEIINSVKDCDMRVASYVYALGGRDIFTKDIERVFEDLISGNISDKTEYLNAKTQ